MRFEEILPLIREGKKARRPTWVSNNYITMKNGIIVGNGGETYSLMYSDLTTEGWQIIEEKPRTKKIILYQYLYMTSNNGYIERWMDIADDDYHIPVLDKNGKHRSKGVEIKA